MKLPAEATCRILSSLPERRVPVLSFSCSVSPPRYGRTRRERKDEKASRSKGERERENETWKRSDELQTKVKEQRGIEVVRRDDGT